jgi:TonB family protein
MTSPSSKRRFVRTALATGVSALSVAAACMTPRPAAAPAQQPAPAPAQQPGAAAARQQAAAQAQQQGEVYPLRELARQDRPTLLSTGPVRIPDSLRSVDGRVVLQWVVDTTGHVVPGSLRILSSSHPGFEAAVREQLITDRWSPGRIGGRAVAVQFPPIPMEFPAASSLPAPEPIAKPTAAELPAGVYAEDAVTERPQLLRFPVPKYPDSLRAAGVSGRVLVEVIVDSSGHADSASVRILSSSHPGFEAPAREVVLGATYAAGRLNGRAVPVLVRFPIPFTIAPGPNH